MNDGVIRGGLTIERLAGIFENAAQTGAERNGPPLVRIQFPVRCDDRRTREVPALYKVVVNKVLQQERIDLGPIFVACNGPQIVRQESERPVPRLHTANDRWTRGSFTSDF